jgi:hypothetical protein
MLRLKCATPLTSSTHTLKIMASSSHIAIGPNLNPEPKIIILFMMLGDRMHCSKAYKQVH